MCVAIETYQLDIKDPLSIRIHSGQLAHMRILELGITYTSDITGSSSSVATELIQTRQDGLVIVHQAQITTSTEGIAEYDLRGEGEATVGAVARMIVRVGQA